MVSGMGACRAEPGADLLRIRHTQSSSARRQYAGSTWVAGRLEAARQAGQRPPVLQPVADLDRDGAQWIVLRSTSGTITYQSFGRSSDTLVPADYDGDHRTDLAVYRPGTGEWWIHRSSDSADEVHQFGAPGDLPVPVDYTGDGSTDVAVYQPAGGEWLIEGAAPCSFGDRTDLPVAAAPLPGRWPKRGPADQGC
jgi:hypothetical protein